MIRPDGLTLEEFFKKRASEGIQIVLMVCVRLLTWTAPRQCTDREHG
jgi:hypothetical protein